MKKITEIVFVVITAAVCTANISCRQIYMSNSAIGQLDATRERLAAAPPIDGDPPFQKPAPIAIKEKSAAETDHNNKEIAIYNNWQGFAAGASFSDKALAQLMKFAANAVDRALVNAEDKYRADLLLTYKMPAPLPENEKWLTLRRSVRIPNSHFYNQEVDEASMNVVKAEALVAGEAEQQSIEEDDSISYKSGFMRKLSDVKKPRFTPSVWHHYIKPMIQKEPKFHVADDKEWEAEARDGWWTTKAANNVEIDEVQLTTHEVGLRFERSTYANGSKAIAIREGYLRVYFSDSALPNYEQVRSRFLDIIQKHERRDSKFRELLGNLYQKADDKIVDEISLRVGMEIKLIWNDEAGNRYERSVTTGTKNIWPADTVAFTRGAIPGEFNKIAAATPACRAGSDSVLWAPVYPLNFDNQEWIPLSSGPITIQLRIVETSKFVDLLEKIREYIKDWTEKQTKGK